MRKRIVDVGEKLASLGLVLLEFKEAKKLDSDIDCWQWEHSAFSSRRISL